MITEIKYGTTRNLKDYNSERIDATYVVAEGECAVTALASLKNFVNTGCIPESVKAITPQIMPEVAEITPQIMPEKEVKKEEPKKEEPKKEVVKKEVAKKEVKAKAEKPKEIPYSREVKEHKAFLATILNDKFPTWRTDAELKAVALTVSEQLVGVPVLDNKGTLLESFITKVIELMEGPQL